MIKTLVAVAFLGLNAYTYYAFSTEAVIPARETFESFPLELESWRCEVNQPIESRIVRKLGVSDYLNCVFEREAPAAVASVYVGYHEHQVREGAKSFAESSIHPPRHCLPGSGWNVMDAAIVPLELPGLPGGAEANRLIIAKGNSRQVVYYWYQSRGHVIARDWEKILRMFTDRARLGRTDGSLVRFTVPLVRGNEAEADAAFRDLASLLVPRLPDYVPN